MYDAQWKMLRRLSSQFGAKNLDELVNLQLIPQFLEGGEHWMNTKFEDVLVVLQA